MYRLRNYIKFGKKRPGCRTDTLLLSNSSELYDRSYYNVQFHFISFFCILLMILLPLDIIIIRLVQKWETEGLGLLKVISISGLNYLFYHLFMPSHLFCNFDIIIFQQYKKTLSIHK